MPKTENQAPKRPKQRKSVSALTSKKLYQEADNRCPFCGVADVAVLEIHHIDEDPSINKIENLIVVCGNCHSKITRGEISPADVHAKKMELFWTHRTSPRQAEKSPRQTVSVNAVSVSDSIIANTVTFGRKRSPRMQYPVDAIGADTIKKGYIDYLIKRYFDYRQADASYGSHRSFSHAEIHTTIQRRFKAKTFFIHVSRFEELCDYIKSRVDQSIQGKRNRSRGVLTYDSFEKYEAEQLRHGR
ncbi:MAG TPA: HNH endonuclease [Desulfonatronum sp.]|nr:HNH endonuclease [Desulfonatronum sp.]